jgi:hypothetical protein
MYVLVLDRTGRTGECGGDEISVTLLSVILGATESRI